MGGKVKYSDNRKSITRDLVTSTATVFNGALTNEEFVTLPISVFKLTSPSGTNRLLTSMPSTGMRITPTQQFFLNIGNFYTTVPRFVYFENDEGDVYFKSVGGSSGTAIRQMGVGPGNLGTLTEQTGVLPLVKDHTKWYDVWVTDSNDIPLTKRYRFEIDRRCQINEIELLFLDRLGSLASFAFQNRTTESGNVKRESYVKALGELDTELDRWNYGLDEAGTTLTSVTEELETTIRTNWMTDEQSVYFKELITSPFILKREAGGAYISVQIKDTSFPIERTKNKKLIKKTITITPSNQNNINL
jgi:hypothetical protein